MDALRRVINRNELRPFSLPDTFGSEDDEEIQFLTTAYLSTIENNERECQLWNKYCKNNPLTHRNSVID